jgi:hypothetical protein
MPFFTLEDAISTRFPSDNAIVPIWESPDGGKLIGLGVKGARASDFLPSLVAE